MVGKCGRTSKVRSDLSFETRSATPMRKLRTEGIRGSSDVRICETRGIAEDASRSIHSVSDSGLSADCKQIIR